MHVMFDLSLIALFFYFATGEKVPEVRRPAVCHNQFGDGDLVSCVVCQVLLGFGVRWGRDDVSPKGSDV